LVLIALLLFRSFKIKEIVLEVRGVAKEADLTMSL
jgi:hypothetical protein